VTFKSKPPNAGTLFTSTPNQLKAQAGWWSEAFSLFKEQESRLLALGTCGAHRLDTLALPDEDRRNPVLRGGRVGDEARRPAGVEGRVQLAREGGQRGSETDQGTRTQGVSVQLAH
jgi:hypothetical protein